MKLFFVLVRIPEMAFILDGWRDLPREVIHEEVSVEKYF